MTLLLLSSQLSWSHLSLAGQVLDHHLDRLYQTVQGKFDSDANFSPAPEFQMPSARFFKMAMRSYCTLLESSDGKSVTNLKTFGIMDYSQDALVRRFYVYDLPSQSIVHNTWGTHAERSTLRLHYDLGSDVVLEYSDVNTSHYFSNVPESDISTVGMTVAEPAPYFSDSFLSQALRMNGKDPALNGNIYMRDIVLHGNDYHSADVRRDHELPSSLGCLMFPKDDFLEGVDHVRVSDVITNSLIGSPVLLFHQRLLSAAQNERSYQAELSDYAKLHLMLNQNLKTLAEKYQWSGQQLQTHLDDYAAQLKRDVYDRLESTHEYFRNRSNTIGKSPISDLDCIKRLGID